MYNNWLVVVQIVAIFVCLFAFFLLFFFLSVSFRLGVSGRRSFIFRKGGWGRGEDENYWISSRMFRASVFFLSDSNIQSFIFQMNGTNDKNYWILITRIAKRGEFFINTGGTTRLFTKVEFWSPRRMPPKMRTCSNDDAFPLQISLSFFFLLVIIIISSNRLISRIFDKTLKNQTLLLLSHNDKTINDIVECANQQIFRSNREN